MDKKDIEELTLDEFNKLCIETIKTNTGVYMKVNYDDPASAYPNPDINNKHKIRDKVNVIKFMK